MQLIKAHTDVMTVPSELRKMKAEYEENGIECELAGNILKLNFGDGYAIISWEKDGFFEECYKYDENGNPVIIFWKNVAV